MFVPCFVVHYLVSLLFCNHLEGEEIDTFSCFTLIIFLMSYDCKCSVPLPYLAVGWSVVCDCGIS